ncbi:hypothetical protein Btru_057114 [Bulinus truncatus]|nr:hypothetical protein Btru_057114 [Bulinus truncatus]
MSSPCLVGGYCADNVQGGYSTDNVQGGYCADNVQGGYSTDNVQGGYCADNVQGRYCADNVQGRYCADNVQGRYSTDNVQGRYSTDNVQGGYCADNVQGRYSTDNVQGRYCADNVQGRYCADNVQGGYSTDNVQGGYRADNVQDYDGPQTQCPQWSNLTELWPSASLVQLSKSQVVSTSSEEFSTRKDRVRQVCGTTKVEGQVHGVYTHKSGVIYCYVPKAGCTFWKRVFTAANFTGDRDPFHISRVTVHELYGSGEVYSSSHKEAACPTRLLVVRDPFSRLLSSYLDKIYLPDFWSSVSEVILKARGTCNFDFLRNHFESMALLFEAKVDSTCSESLCGKYLTFSDFVRGVIDVKEPHWMPIHEICNPCTFNVTHLVYMESFNQDSRPVLDQMEMTHVLNQVDKLNQVDREIEMLTDYHFNQTQDGRFLRSCITARELAYRLWHSFQWKGYIDPEMTFILPGRNYSVHCVKQNLLRQLWAARRSGLTKPDVMWRASEIFKEKAFRSLSKPLFESIMSKFKTDFQLFG